LIVVLLRLVKYLCRLVGDNSVRVVARQRVQSGLDEG